MATTLARGRNLNHSRHKASAMQTIVARCWCILVVALATFGPTVSAADKEEPGSATQQYTAALALQNREAYAQAAELWAKFIDAHNSDPRCDRAFQYLGVCYLKTNRLELARQCFEIVIK